MFIIWGSRGITKIIDSGFFHCPLCNQIQSYVIKQVKKWGTLFFVPILPMEIVGEYVECQKCGSAFIPDYLNNDTKVMPNDGQEVNLSAENQTIAKNAKIFHFLLICGLLLWGGAFSVYLLTKSNDSTKVQSLKQQDSDSERLLILFNNTAKSQTFKIQKIYDSGVQEINIDAASGFEIKIENGGWYRIIADGQDIEFDMSKHDMRYYCALGADGKFVFITQPRTIEDKEKPNVG